MSGELTSIDTENTDTFPLLYDIETRISHSFKCSRPLFITPSMNYISLIVDKPFPPILDIWKALSHTVWYYTLIAYVAIVLTNKAIHTYGYRADKSLIELLWIHAKPLLAIGNQKLFNKYNYLFLNYKLFQFI